MSDDNSMSLNMGHDQMEYLARVTKAVHTQTEAIVSAMDAQTKEIVRLSEKVDVMQSRVIRLEEQRHGKDIEKLSDAQAEMTKRVTELEMRWAQARGASALMDWMRNFLPWIAGLILIFLTATGFDFDKWTNK